MRDPAPLTIQRLLTLRQFEGFNEVDLSELATVAENMIERTFAPGALIVNAGSRFPGAYLVVQGRLEAPGHVWGPRSVVGVLEMIAARSSEHRIAAAAQTRVLLLPESNFDELLEDNYGVLSTTRRLIARLMLGYGSAPFTPQPVPRFGRTLGMVDRILALRAYLPIADGNLQAVSALAQASEELEYAAGTQIHHAGEEPAATLVVLDGQVRLRRHTGMEAIAATSTIGALESLAEVPHVDDAHALTRVRALRLPNAALFDVMEDHTDFAIAMVRRLAGELLDLQQFPPEVN
jgi:CRP-like cAMP-binding protein